MRTIQFVIRMCFGFCLEPTYEAAKKAAAMMRHGKGIREMSRSLRGVHFEAL